MEKHHSPHTVIGTQVRGTGGGGRGQLVRVIYGIYAEVPSDISWLSLGQERAEEWKIKS